MEVKLRAGDSLLFGCFYRSPTPSNESNQNNKDLNHLFRMLSSRNYSHMCLVGDFNFPDINWTTWTTIHNEESKEVAFIDTARDCFYINMSLNIVDEEVTTLHLY